MSLLRRVRLLTCAAVVAASSVVASSVVAFAVDADDDNANPTTRPSSKPAVAGRAAPAAKKVPSAPVEDHYTIERIKMPPGLSAEVGGLDVLPDGRVVACFHRGEVYTYDPGKKEWKLFAEGLHDPLGLVAVSDREVVVMQRPELTRLRDTDGDGVADQYTTLSDAFGITGNYHEFAFGPVRDRDGNFLVALNVASNGAGIRSEVRGELRPATQPVSGRMYAAVPWRGWVLKISPDGKTTTPFASGFRSPNGLGFDADGNLFIPDNQGDWVGSSPLFHVEQGKFYGHVASLRWKDGEARDPLKIPVAELEAMRTRPAVVFPHSVMAGSPTQPLLDSTGGKFGPFAGQMLIADYNRPRIMRVMLERVDGQLQGAVTSLIDGNIGTGINRLAFAPDGALWVGHTTHGWGGSAGIDRVTFTGKRPLDVKEMRLTKKGFDLVFTQPVQAASAGLPSTYKFKRYYYKYHSNYGSPQTDLEDVPVAAVSLSPDRTRVSLELEDMVAWRVYELSIDGLKADDGSLMMNPLLCYTLNRFHENTPPPPEPGK